MRDHKEAAKGLNSREPLMVLPGVRSTQPPQPPDTSQSRPRDQSKVTKPVRFLEPLAIGGRCADTADEATSCFISESETHDEMLSISTSTAMSCPALKIRNEWGAPASSLLQGDLARNQTLKKKLADLRLSDFFDAHGGPHFKRLSISFAAKQNHDVASTFGSTGDLHALESEDPSDFLTEGEGEDEDGNGMLGSSKAFLAASEALAKDLRMTREKADALLRKVRNEERLRTADVDQRRLNLLFAEIPSFESLVPKEIDIKDLMPADLLEEEEVAEKQSMERQNAFLTDKKFIEGQQMFWLFPQAEVLVISKCLQRWCVSTRGSNLTIGTSGMDRPTFCRFLFDMDLIGEGVPYFWAVSLFDSVAQPMRLCTHANHSATAPLQPIVNRFRLISVVDVILRQRFDTSSREEFLKQLKEFAKKLKIYGDEVKRDLDRSEAREEWRSQPEKDLARRERLISAMLIEPEVLHVVSAFHHVFRTLFDCYAPSGHMQYTDLWQFCVDFQLTPQFITEQQLRKAYEVVECFDILPARLVREPPRARKQTVRDPKRHRSKTHSANSAHSASAPSSMHSVSPAPSNLSDVREESERAERTRDSVLSGAASTTSAAEESELLECETVFGPNAFAEALCRICFLYLGFYGSTLQQSSSSYFKVSWLISFLRRISTLMCESQGSLTGGAASLQSMRWLGSSGLDGLALFWEPRVDDLETATAAVLQPLPGPGNRKATRRRSKQQTMAPRLKPSRRMKEATQSVNKQKTLSSIREAAKNLGKAAMVVKAMSETQKLSGVIPRKFDDSSSEEEVHAPSRPVATKDRIEALTTQVAASFQKPLKPQKTVKAPGPLMPVEELFKVEGGCRAIAEKEGGLEGVKGVCQLCDRTGGLNQGIASWGNPRCRGCSIVDAINLKAHPFARLLQPECHTNAKILRPKAKAQLGARLRAVFTLPASTTHAESHALLD